MAGETKLAIRVFGSPGAPRLVVLVVVGIAWTIDPLPAATVKRNIRVLAVGLDSTASAGPGAFGDGVPADSAADALERLIREELDEPAATVGIVAYRAGGDVALRTAAALGETVDRLALVAVPMPDDPFDRGGVAGMIEAAITAKTLVVNGQGDPLAASAEARWYKEHIASSRIETVPGDGVLALPHVWDRVLSHVAPGTKRK